jgi:hypothetical protein
LPFLPFSFFFAWFFSPLFQLEVQKGYVENRKKGGVLHAILEEMEKKKGTKKGAKRATVKSLSEVPFFHPF